MKLFKYLSIFSFSLIPLSTIKANELNFENIKFDQTENRQNIYEPKDKLDEYIIKGATFATKFVPLMNDGSDASAYKSIMANDGKSLLVDSGFSSDKKVTKIIF